MPRNVALNIALRNIVRRDLVPVVHDDLPDLEPPDDTEAERVDLFRSAGVIPTKRKAREQDLRARRRAAIPALVPGQGLLVNFSSYTSLTGSANLLGEVLGPIPFPFIIDSISYRQRSGAAVGTENSQGVAILTSFDQELTLAAVLSDQNVVALSDTFIDGVRVFETHIAGGTTVEHSFPIGYQEPRPSIFLKAIVEVPGGLVQNPDITLVIKELTLPQIRTLSASLPVGRTTFNINTRAPRARTRARSVPRGAVISVTQGGRTINQRTIAWQSLTPALRRDWFNRQIGGEADPNIRWLP